MSMEMHLHALANSARNLLECDQACICLYCPEPDLRHPLLALFSVLHARSTLYYGILRDPTFLSEEHLWATCDRVAVMGQNSIENIQIGQWGEGLETPTNIMIAMLERPAGIVGFLFCTSRQSEAFLEGERCLLTHFMPELARQVEQILSEDCTTVSAASDEEKIAIGIQEQSAFLSLISHELRAPLMAIKGYTGLLQEYGPKHEDMRVRISNVQQQRYLAVIMEQINHLEVLIGDVLDVSHIHAGRLALHCSYVDLGVLCRQITQMMQCHMNQPETVKYCILYSVDPELPLVWADVDRVQQILTNLVENAIKYSPGGGLIKIQIRASTHCALNCTCMCKIDKNRELKEGNFPDVSQVCVTVSDQGIGIPRQQQSSLFKPFTRLEHPATRHISGTGLGLYIAHKLIKAMHGQVFLRSSEGKGTTITFTLPLTQSTDTQTQSQQKKQPLVQTVSTH